MIHPYLGDPNSTSPVRVLRSCEDLPVQIYVADLFDEVRDILHVLDDANCPDLLTQIKHR